jgi:hypothetical protein
VACLGFERYCLRCVGQLGYILILSFHIVDFCVDSKFEFTLFVLKDVAFRFFLQESEEILV